MSSEIIIYPKNPYELTWESYISEYPIHMSNIESEECKLKDEINDIKNKIFGLVGAVPRDLCNENDDPFEYVTYKMKSLLSDYKFIVGRLWKLSMIERFDEILEDGKKNNRYETIDEDTGKPWRPYIWFCGMYAEDEYQCDSSIEENNDVINMLVNKLMMLSTSTPDKCFTDNENDETSFDIVFFNVREILDSEDGLEYHWWRNFDWQFVKDNFTEDSYSSY